MDFVGIRRVLEVLEGGRDAQGRQETFGRQLNIVWRVMVWNRCLTYLSGF